MDLDLDLYFDSYALFSSSVADFRFLDVDHRVVLPVSVVNSMDVRVGYKEQLTRFLGLEPQYAGQGCFKVGFEVPTGGTELPMLLAELYHVNNPTAPLTEADVPS